MENVELDEDPREALLKYAKVRSKYLILYTVEPPNNGNAETSHFVLYREVVLSLEVKMY